MATVTMATVTLRYQSDRMYHDSTGSPAAEAASPWRTASRDIQRQVQPDTGHSTWSLSHTHTSLPLTSLPHTWLCWYRGVAKAKMAGDISCMDVVLSLNTQVFEW